MNTVGLRCVSRRSLLQNKRYTATGMVLAVSPRMKSWLRRHPFLTLGLATFALFVLVESVPAVRTAVVIQVLRVLLVPLWLMRTLEMMVGMGTWWGILQLIVALPLLFAPYVLADWALARVRTRRASSLNAAAV